MSIKPVLWPRATHKYMVKIIDKLLLLNIKKTGNRAENSKTVLRQQRISTIMLSVKQGGIKYHFCSLW